MEYGKRFWNFCNSGYLWTRTEFSPHLGITACLAGVAGYPSGCASGCALGCAGGCGSGCLSGSLPYFFEDCGPNKENASSSIACIRRRVSFMSISDSSLEALETDSDLSRFLSRSWNVAKHLLAKITSKSCFVIIFPPWLRKLCGQITCIDLHITEISLSLQSYLSAKSRLKLNKKSIFSALWFKVEYDKTAGKKNRKI